LPFDIHGGGADLKFPHHENEIAQSCCGVGALDDASAFAKFWVHNGFVTVEGEKMSKSLGNFTVLHDLIGEYPGPVLRIALLMAQYRQPLDWSEQVLHQAKKLYERIGRVSGILEDVVGHEGIEYENSVTAALLDDLNTPLAFSRLNGMLNSAIQSQDSGDDALLRSLKGMINKAIDVLGIEILAEEDVLHSDFDGLLEARAAAKAAKDFARADEIRDEIAAQGYEIVDTREGSTVRKI